MRAPAIVALALAPAAACGDNAAVAVDAAAAVDAAPPSCTATFSGNFAQTSTSAANCATLTTDGSGDTLLVLSLAAARLAVPLAISIDLGPSPAAGEYSSETIRQWSAEAYARDLAGGGGVCQFSAGSTATPQGSFTLVLDAISVTTAHGVLSVTQYVLAFLDTQCGAGDVELVTVMF